MVRMSIFVLHLFRPEGAPWLDWFVRISRCARERQAIGWGDQPVAIIAARAVSGSNALISRLECSIDGRVIRWRSAAAADMDAINHLCGVRQGPRPICRVGRPHLRWEESPLPIVGYLLVGGRGGPWLSPGGREGAHVRRMRQGRTCGFRNGQGLPTGHTSQIDACRDLALTSGEVQSWVQGPSQCLGFRMSLLLSRCSGCRRLATRLRVSDPGDGTARLTHF